jgi:hypothetical protein
MPHADPSTPPANAASLTAFIHGIEARAWVFALRQCGDADLATAVFDAAVHDFLVSAPTLTLPRWPLQFWTHLLRQPQMLAEAIAGRGLLAQLAPGPRAALLLRLIAGLDFGPAAQVLEVSPAAYQDALREALDHPDMDDSRMQELREQLHAQIHDLPAERRDQLARLRAQAIALRPLPVPVAAPAPEPRRRHLWIWLALLLAALAASFYWPLKSLIAPGQHEALPEEPVAPPPPLSDTVVLTHPDYAQIAAPADEALAVQLPLLSWVASARAPDPGPARAAAAPVPVQFDSLAAADQALLSSAEAAWPQLDAATRASLLANARDWQARSPAQRQQLRARLRQWDRQHATARALRRAPFLAWQALDGSEQARVRQAAGHFLALPALEQQALRGQFAALPADSQRLWSMGPALGEEMVPIAALFTYLPEAERPAMLAALRGLDRSSRSDLALLAQRLGETRRQALIRELLATSAAQRPALIRQRLAQ